MGFAKFHDSPKDFQGCPGKIQGIPIGIPGNHDLPKDFQGLSWNFKEQSCLSNIPLFPKVFPDLEEKSEIRGKFWQAMILLRIPKVSMRIVRGFP